MIVSVNGEKINNSRELSLKIAEIDPNTSVDVKFWRSGKEDSLKVKLGTFPSKEDEIAGGPKSDPDKSPVAAAKEIEGLGLKLSSERGGASDGVAIAEVDDDSNAAQKGLKPGDVILEVNGEAVSSPTQVQEQVKKVRDAGRSAVMLYVQSGEQKVQLAVPFTKKG